MTTKTITQTSDATSVASKFSVELVSNDAGTSHRLQAMFHDWNPATDLSLTTLSQAKAGMEAMAKYVAGGFSGNARLFTVAPTEKLAYLNGTGVFAYVRDDYRPGLDDAVVMVGNAQVHLSVRSEFIPPERGFRRLRLDGGQLYAETWEGYSTSRGEIDTDGNISMRRWNDKLTADTFSYWYARCASTLLEENNVSISVGPRMIVEAERIMAVVNAEDPAAANEERRWIGRESSRGTTEVREAAASMPAGFVANDSDLQVPLFAGGTISARKFVVGKPIHVMMGAVPGADKYLRTGTDAERAALASTLINRGWTVKL
jgi:hypothetical protein